MSAISPTKSTAKPIRTILRGDVRSAMRAPTSAAIIIATETGRIATPVSKASLPRTSCR